MDADGLTHTIIGAAIRVHQALGPGLLESAYEKCTGYELKESGLYVEHQKKIPLLYRGVKLDCSYRMDMLVQEMVVVEFKCAKAMDPIFDAQMLTYLRLANLPVGLILNFHVPVLKNGIKRILNGPGNALRVSVPPW
jgi:GxxExxY protein